MTKWANFANNFNSKLELFIDLDMVLQVASYLRNTSRLSTCITFIFLSTQNRFHIDTRNTTQKDNLSNLAHWQPIKSKLGLARLILGS